MCVCTRARVCVSVCASSVLNRSILFSTTEHVAVGSDVGGDVNGEEMREMVACRRPAPVDGPMARVHACASGVGRGARQFWPGDVASQCNQRPGCVAWRPARPGDPRGPEAVGQPAGDALLQVKLLDTACIKPSRCGKPNVRRLSEPHRLLLPLAIRYAELWRYNFS